MESVLFVVAIIIIALLAMFVIPRFMVKRSIKQVIRIFRQQYALDAKSARTIDELKLRPRSMLEGMMKTRDYKPQALQALIRVDIVLTTEDGKLYLSEDKLDSSGIERR